MHNASRLGLLYYKSHKRIVEERDAAMDCKSTRSELFLGGGGTVAPVQSLDRLMIWVAREREVA